MTTAPLAGRRVVVTRTRAQASALAARLSELGATVVELPVIAIEDPPDGGRSLDAAADRVVAGAYEWVVLTSTNAVDRLLAVLGDRTAPPAVRWAAVGAGTARRLSEGGVPADLVPETSVSESLVEAFPPVAPGPPPAPDGRSVGAGTVLLPRAETVRGAVAPGLRAKGWSVDEVVAYRTVAGRPGDEAVAAAVAADAVATFDRLRGGEVRPPGTEAVFNIIVNPIANRLHSRKAVGDLPELIPRKIHQLV